MKRPGLIVGVLAIAAIAYISFNSLRTEGPGSRGIEVGSALPAFAAPLALSRLDGDANLSERACDVRGPDVLNSCELVERGPVVLGFFAEPADRCDDQIDVLDELRGVSRPSSSPRWRSAAIATTYGAACAERGWRLPVGHDRDGAVANAYAVAICPVVTLAARGGEVRRTLLGSQDAGVLEAAVRELG